MTRILSFQNDHIYDSIIRCDWFLMPCADQLKYQFLMQNAQSAKALTVGGIAPLNMTTCLKVAIWFGEEFCILMISNTSQKKVSLKNTRKVPPILKASVKKLLNEYCIWTRIENQQYTGFFYIFTETYFSDKQFFSYFSSSPNRSSRQSIHTWWFFTLSLFKQTLYNIC